MLRFFVWQVYLVILICGSGVGSGPAFSELADDVFDHRERHGDVNVFAGILDIHLNLFSDRADSDMRIGVLDFDKCGVGIAAKLFGGDAGDGSPVFFAVVELMELLVGDEMERHGDYSGGSPDVDMRAAAAVFVNVNADGAFTEGIDGSDGESCGSAESDLSEN
jgi:hypothetical protein